MELRTALEIVIRELGYAARSIRKGPAFSIVAILTLALGIGASTAVFTAVDSILLQPLSYRDSGRLIVAWERIRFLASDPLGPNPRHADVWQKRATAFTGLALLRQSAAGLVMGNEHPQLVATITAQPNLFDVLQVSPALGRTFRKEDGTKGRDSVAVLSDHLWRTQFRADPAVLGKTVRIADVPREIIGVLPATFHFPNANSLRAFRSSQSASSVPEPAIFLPAAIELNDFSWNGEYGNWIALGRLKPEMTLTQAEAQLESLQPQIEAMMPAAEREQRSEFLHASVQPLQEAVVGTSRMALWLLMTAVLGLMFIACFNLANAQLGRTISRAREIAIRRAIGASRRQLIWSSFAESLLLAVAGGVGGVLLASVILNLFQHYAPVDLPRVSELRLNPEVLVFAFLLTFGSSLLFGILPVLRLLGSDPQAALQQNTNRAAGRRDSRKIRTILVAAQVFGCTVILLLTGLFAKSLFRLLHVDKGFQTAHVVIAEVRLTPKLYNEKRSRANFDDGVLESLRTMPGVESASLVSAMPLEGETWIDSAGRPDRPHQASTLVNVRWVSPRYFETLQERIVAGRAFEDRDRDLKNVILSEGEMRALWKNENPIGARIDLQGQHYTVVGVVADSRNTSLKATPVRVAYLHYQDNPPYSTYFLVRGRQPAESLMAGVRRAIWSHAPTVTIARVRTFDSQVTDSLAAERFQTNVLIFFGGAGLLLAMLGIYGVLSYSVAARKQEIGIRMALGATRQGIYSLTFREAAPPVAAGIVAGLLASFWVARLVQKLLYGVEPVDLSVSLTVSTLFILAAFAAAFIPARRAASVDPMDTLRAQ